MGLPPPSPSLDVIRRPQDHRYRAAAPFTLARHHSTALPSEGSPWLQQRPDSTEARDRRRYDPGPRHSPQGRKESGGHPQTPGMGLPPPSPSPDAIRRPPRPPVWAAAPLTLARQQFDGSSDRG